MPFSADMLSTWPGPKLPTAPTRATSPVSSPTPGAVTDRADVALPDADMKKLQESAKNFEAYVMSFVFSTAYESLPENEFSGGMAENMYQNMFIQETMKSGTANGQGTGLADMMMQQFLRSRGQAPGVGAPLAGGSGAVAPSPTSGAVPPMDLCSPVPIGEDGAEVSSDFGMRHDPLHGGARMHHGVDLALPEGSPIHAAADGTVSFSGTKGGYGNAVMIQHGGGVESMYAHNARNLVREGQAVRRGQVIGYVGSTGRSTGPHVHFEVREGGAAVNPEKYVAFSKIV